MTVNPQLARVVARLASAKVEKVPAGFYTLHQLAEAWDLSHARVTQIVRAAIHSGVMEVRRFRIRSGSFVRLVPHYAEVKRRRRR